MPSSRYRQLSRRINRLKRNLIPAASATGDYSERQLDKVAGFRLLAHAEIEAFLEERAKEVAIRAITDWRATKRPGHVVACMVSHFPKMKIPQQVLDEEKAGRQSRIDFALSAAQASYMHALTKNHGVREENVRRILFPIGVKHADIDATWLNTIDSFGINRGFVAHNAAAAIRPIDPQTEVDTVDQILAGLGLLDAILGKLR
jgi:hypothetical protein